MNGRALKNIGAVITLTLVGVAGIACALVVWVTATTQGTRWLLTAAFPLGGISFSAQKIEGRLLDRLFLSDIRITLAQQKIAINTLELRWKPLLLLSGTIGIQELSINGVRIQDDTPLDTKPPELSWPRLPESAQMFDVMIAHLRLSDINYHRLQEQPLLVSAIDSSVTWQDNLLTASELTIASPSGQVSGTSTAGFNHPSLTANLAIAPTLPVATMDQFSLQIRHSEEMSTKGISGHVVLTGSSDKRTLMELSGDAGMAGNTLNLQRLRLTSPGRRGLITADGVLALAAPEPMLTLRIKASGLDLAPELNVPTDLSGTVRFAGTMSGYHGTLTFANRAKGWQKATLSATYHGTQEGIRLAPLTAGILDGSLAGNVAIDWHDGVALQGTLHGRNINPARINPAWSGAAHFNATGHATWSETKPLSGSVTASLLESRLQGQPLTGELRANYSGNNLLLSRLTLQGKGFDLHASGNLNQRLDVAARIADLSQMVPESAGTVRSKGWLRWHNRQFSGAVTGAGNSLAYAGTRIAAASLVAAFEQSGRQLNLSGSALGSGISTGKDGNIAIERAQVTFTGNHQGTRIDLEAKEATGGRLKGTFTSTEPLRPALPHHGQLTTVWSGINVSLLKPWLPVDTKIEGYINGQVNGIILPGRRFEMDGTTFLSGGAVHQGELNLAVSSATAAWQWHGEALAGTLSLNASEYGQAQATVRLPIPARFPVAVSSHGALQATLTSQLQLQGIATALIPGLVQKSSGELVTDINIGGTWKEPVIGGKLELAKGGGYLPAAGIHLNDVQLTARLEKDLIVIDSYRARSGPGYIEGSATITLSGWHMSGYRGVMRGKNFQTVYLPEFRVVSTPNLSFDGTLDNLKLRGELRLPELQYDGAPTATVIAPSSDVIMAGIVVPTTKSSPLALDVQIKVLIGERVFVKVAGIDAQLGGAMGLTLKSLDGITSSGEISVVKGHYRTYGVDLEIVRGHLFFAGGPIAHPALDFLALRTIGDVRVGVTVGGSLQKPVIKLYSEPPMPDVDILAYIVLGHPYENSGEQAGLITRAAGALLTSSHATLVQEQLKNKFGLSTLEIQGGVGASSGSMGYKPLQATAPGAIPASAQPGATETVLTVGKYVTPQLYISYGKSLFTGSNLFLLRYDIFTKWQIETQTGSESGVDLFYKLEFK